MNSIPSIKYCIPSNPIGAIMLINPRINTVIACFGKAPCKYSSGVLDVING